MKTNYLVTKMIVMLAVICLTVPLISCGSGGQNGGAATGMRSIVITVDWPTRSAASHPTRLVPAATANILISITNQGGTSALTTATIPQGQAQTTISGLPGTALTATATANDANGNAIATGATDFTTTVSATTAVSITMKSTIIRLVATPANPIVAPGATLQLQAMGVNTLGKTVLLTANNLVWTDTSASDAQCATVSAGGVITGIKDGVVNLSVLDKESGATGGASVIVGLIYAITNSSTEVDGFTASEAHLPTVTDTGAVSLRSLAVLPQSPDWN